MHRTKMQHWKDQWCGPSGFYGFWKGDTKKPHIILESWQTSVANSWKKHWRYWSNFFHHRNFNQMLNPSFFLGYFPWNGGHSARLSNGAFWDPTNLRSFFESTNPNQRNVNPPTKCPSQPTKKKQPTPNFVAQFQPTRPNLNQPDPTSV